MIEVAGLLKTFGDLTAVDERHSILRSLTPHVAHPPQGIRDGVVATSVSVVAQREHRIDSGRSPGGEVGRAGGDDDHQ